MAGMCRVSIVAAYTPAYRKLEARKAVVGMTVSDLGNMTGQQVASNIAGPVGYLGTGDRG
jgi:hypothetical protein